jgi:hypothetical protein
MAIYHLRAKVIGRAAGKNAVASAAYRQGGYSVVAMAGYRSGSSLTDERTGRTWDYTRKGGVEHTEIMAPDHAPAWALDRSELWNRVEAGEKRKDAQLAREIEISLPRELSAEQCIDLVRAYVRTEFVHRGMIADVAIHRPRASDGGEQPHAHIMLTMRSLDGDGFGRKERSWNGDDLLIHWREAWSVTANAALANAGQEARIDHRSLKEQGIEREPAPYLPQLAFFERVREFTGGLRERFGQWVAIRHRNRVRDHLAAMEQSQGEGGLEELIGALLGRAARSLGLERVIPLGPNLGEHSLDR